MNNNQIIIKRNDQCKEVDNGYKIIEVNVTDPSENLFAVVTPIKKQ